MIKPINIIGLFIIALSAFGVFQIKHHVQNLKKDIIDINKYISQEKETLHVLKAEWAYLSKPERLKKIIDNHLNLQIVKIEQMHKLTNDLPCVLSEIEISPTIIEEDNNDVFSPVIRKNTSNIKLVKNKSLENDLRPKLSKVKY